MQKDLVFSFAKTDFKKFQSFIEKNKKYKVIDLFEDLFIQYKLVNNPNFYFEYKKNPEKVNKTIFNSIDKKVFFSFGKWILLPGLRSIYHLLNPLDYLNLRTVRNRNLITFEEQKILYNKKIVFVGLSVGSQVLVTMVRSGIGNKITIVDGDEVELHNLNRANFFLKDLGREKVEVIKEQINEIDPYILIEPINEYLTKENMSKILKDADLIIDSFDNFLMKIELRKYAKKNRIPVISGFDLSKGTIVITERYDLDKNIPISFYLNGYSEQDILSLFNKTIKEKTEIFINIIGEKYHDKRMLASVLDVGEKLTGYPQLAIAANLTSASWTIAAIDILLKKKAKSKRVYINLQEIIEKG